MRRKAQRAAYVFFAAVQRFQRNRRGLLNAQQNRVSRLRAKIFRQRGAHRGQLRTINAVESPESLIHSVNLDTGCTAAAGIANHQPLKRDERAGGETLVSCERGAQLLREEIGSGDHGVGSPNPAKHQVAQAGAHESPTTSAPASTATAVATPALPADSFASNTSDCGEPACQYASVNGPATRRDQLRKVAVRIAEIDALPPRGQVMAALDFDAVLLSLRSQPARSASKHQKREVLLTAPAAHGGSTSPGNVHRLKRATLLKIQEYLAPRNAQCTKAANTDQLIKSKDAARKIPQTCDVVHTDARFEYARDVHTLFNGNPSATTHWKPGGKLRNYASPRPESSAGCGASRAAWMPPIRESTSQLPGRARRKAVAAARAISARAMASALLLTAGKFARQVVDAFLQAHLLQQLPRTQLSSVARSATSVGTRTFSRTEHCGSSGHPEIRIRPACSRNAASARSGSSNGLRPSTSPHLTSAG